MSSKPIICATVGELLKVLSKLDPATRILCSGPDSGGYDTTLNGRLQVSPPPPQGPNHYYIRTPGFGEVTDPDPKDAKKFKYRGPYYREDNAFFHAQPMIVFEGVPTEGEKAVWEEQEEFNCRRGYHCFITDGGGLRHVKTCYKCGAPNPLYEPDGRYDEPVACELRRKVLLNEG